MIEIFTNLQKIHNCNTKIDLIKLIDIEIKIIDYMEERKKL